MGSRSKQSYPGGDKSEAMNTYRCLSFKRFVMSSISDMDFRYFFCEVLFVGKI